jgi:uncharacterized membrane protein YkvA (DUF1232 family)
MTDVNTKCLETFPGWLRSLDEDVQLVFRAIENTELPVETRKFLVGGINYLFKSLDLVPDGIDDIGYLDDAFVLRLSVKSALEEETDALDPELMAKLGQLANDVDLVDELLEKDVFDRLDKYTRDLRKGAARGRTVDEIVDDENVFKEFASEVGSFVKGYTSPGFAKDQKNLIKLKAFLEAKLPK